jgi:chemotaxis protein CheY-P-specific phosphatase CheC
MMENGTAGLTRLQLDALKEIASIGAGNTATALSQFINRRIAMSSPEVLVASGQGIPVFTAGQSSRMMIVNLAIVGEVPGYMMFVCEYDDALRFIDILLGGNGGFSSQTVPEMGLSALKEVGSVMCGCFLSVLSDILNTVLRMTPPDFVIVTPEYFPDFIKNFALKEDKSTVCLKCDLAVAGDPGVFISLLFIPLSVSVKPLLKLLGLREE